jgi:Sulfotransferase domain
MSGSTPAVDPPRRRFAAMGFGLHYANMALLGDGDIALPSIGGAGSSLLGNILLELGLNYVDPTKEPLGSDGSSAPPTDRITARVRTGTRGTPPRRDAGFRYAKTHLPAEEYAGVRFGGVWLLVRDPRDALFSWYQYHRSFAEVEWEKVPDTFEEFLATPFFTERPPVGTWCSFNQGWLEYARSVRHSRVLRFEDLKQDAFGVMRDALTALAVDVEDRELDRAVAASTFESMRAHEDSVADPHDAGAPVRVMRSGRVGGWTEWMNPRLQSFFDGNELSFVARRFGYSVPGR